MESGLVVTAELDVMEVRLTEVRLMVVRVETMRLGRKSKNCLSPTICLSPKTVESDFLILGAKLVFTKLRQAFVKALILQHFDPERHIRIETDVSGYAISGVLSQLISDDLG